MDAVWIDSLDAEESSGDRRLAVAEVVVSLRHVERGSWLRTLARLQSTENGVQFIQFDWDELRFKEFLIGFTGETGYIQCSLTFDCHGRYNSENPPMWIIHTSPTYHETVSRHTILHKVLFHQLPIKWINNSPRNSILLLACLDVNGIGTIVCCRFWSLQKHRPGQSLLGAGTS